jgi:ribosome maturation factor RimP
MISETSLQKIEILANDVALREGVKIYDIEFSGGAQGRILRIYIDKEGGVGVDDCANVSRGLNLLLDVEDPIPGGKYVLEVSSPGLDRVLKKNWHFEQAVGKKIWIKTARAFEAFGFQHKKLKTAKQISETLLAFENEALKFTIEGEDLIVPMNALEKAKMVFEIEQKNNKKHPHKGSK